jgi:hypothetical protein
MFVHWYTYILRHMYSHRPPAFKNTIFIIIQLQVENVSYCQSCHSIILSEFWDSLAASIYINVLRFVASGN